MAMNFNSGPCGGHHLAEDSGPTTFEGVHHENSEPNTPR